MTTQHIEPVTRQREALPENYDYADLKRCGWIEGDEFYSVPSEQAMRWAAKAADIQWTTISMMLERGNMDPGFVRTFYALARAFDEIARLQAATTPAQSQQTGANGGD